MKGLVFLTLLGLVAVQPAKAHALAPGMTESSLSSRADELFEEFKKKFHRSYESEDEENKRREIFRQSMARADGKNKVNGQVAFGVTKYSDMTLDEFRVLLGRKGHGVNKENEQVEVRSPSLRFSAGEINTKLGADETGVNWVALGKTTAVKNQGQCGSCWAFSAAEQVETAWLMANNPRWEFSPQQIASCTPDCYGCGGGDTISAYDYLLSNSTAGLSNSWFAPYVQSMYQSCSTRKCTESCSDLNLNKMVTQETLAGPFAVLSGYDYAVPPCYGACNSQDMEKLSDNVAEYGPASVCVNAETWNDYTGGVLTDAACGSHSFGALDHCVQLVGFNSTAETPYWIVRNSWSIDWGMNGYILLEYPANTCGIADEATFVTVKN